MSNDIPCSLCAGVCKDADVAPLLVPTLAWFWNALAATADRRGDQHMVSGPNIRVTAPDDPTERAAAVGLLGGPIGPGQRRTLRLARLAELVRLRGPLLTPGAVAAHAVGRPLAERAHARIVRTEQMDRLGHHFGKHLPATIGLVNVKRESVVETLRRNGTLARLLENSDPTAVIGSATRVAALIPHDGTRVDRRVLAGIALSDPHALDHGQPVEVLVRAILSAIGLASPGERARLRWASVGVDWDELTGGLSAVGIHPDGWHLPRSAVVTIPPLELATCSWPTAPPGSWAFVTENPSVLAAARDLAADGATPRLLCTSGTPSQLEAEAIGRLATAGWNVAVRADFDDAGLRHVWTLLRETPGSIPWRMRTEDYLASFSNPDGPALSLTQQQQLSSPWDPDLATTMQRTGVKAFEEALLPKLLHDLVSGSP